MVLLELLTLGGQRFNSQRPKANLFKDLLDNSRQLPEEDRMPKPVYRMLKPFVPLIQAMISHDPESRPTAVEALRMLSTFRYAAVAFEVPGNGDWDSVTVKSFGQGATPQPAGHRYLEHNRTMLVKRMMAFLKSLGFPAGMAKKGCFGVILLQRSRTSLLFDAAVW